MSKENQFKVQVNSKEEKLLTNQLDAIWKAREAVAKQIVELLKKYAKSYITITPLENQIYQLSGEFGLDDYYKDIQKRFPNALYLDENVDFEDLSKEEKA